MKFNKFLLIALFLIFKTYSSDRILYVDEFYHILGNTFKEEKLLQFTLENGFDKIILYDLHKVNKYYPLADPKKNHILAKFIYKAKVNYGLKEVGGSGESGEFFMNAIHAYNKTRKNPNEKFDSYNLEYEYWKEDDSSEGGYYCESYLKRYGKTCDRAGTFDFFLNSLSTMKALADNSNHPIKIEAYVGKFEKHEINKIAKLVDRLLVHVYVRDPKKGFNYVSKRLQFLSEIEKKPIVSIIYSSETLFMGGWLKYNSLKKGEKIFLDSMQAEDKQLLKNINFTNFTYYNYNQLAKSVDYYNYLQELAYKKEAKENLDAIASK